MNRVKYFLNFNVGAEIDLAGSFAYNAISILNSVQDIYQKDQIFLFLYNAAISVERLQKCVLFMHNEDEIGEFAETIKSHGHQKLQCKIVESTGLRLPPDQNAMLELLQNYYADGRYSNLTPNTHYDYKNAFEEFVSEQYGPDMLGEHWLSNEHYISNKAKEYIGRTLGKLLHNYYRLISDRARELNLYTHELRSDSPAYKVFLHQFPRKSLQAISDEEKNAFAELIVFLSNSKDSTGFLDYLRSIEPLKLDPILVQEYLVDIMNKQIPQGLVDEVYSIYCDMPVDMQNRKEALSVIGADNVVFPEDDEVGVDDGEGN